MLSSDRRGFMLGLAATAAASSGCTTAQTTAPSTAMPPLPAAAGQALATDNAYWAAVRSLYAVTPEIVNLENGYWGVMSEPVRREYLAKTDMVNRDNSFYARNAYGREMEPIRAALAAAVGCATEEIAFTRGATEAMQLLIAGYNKLKAGDSVLYADLDYDSMQYAMNWLKDRRGVDVVRFAIPEPATREAVLQTYHKQLADNPKARLLLLTHLSHRTGLVIPVAEIAAMARARGVDVVVDAAHSWGQIDFKVGELGADFVGFNLHKWIGAPLGAGFMYIKKPRLPDIDRALGDEDFPTTDIRSRVHTGTANFAAFLTLPAALKLHQEIGPRAKALRLRHLRDYWVSRVRGFKGMEILTPDEPGMAAGITSFRLAGKTSAADNNAIVAQLRDKHGIFTVRRAGVAKGQCIRISPALYTAEADMDKLVAALKAVTA
ncbi:MAG TPA: aminotransferase class V-fold PLP-dependent enzyme [Burkholderiaceae bacterium]|nr:aminotransferase class V-fold PLP-dependent enzyme [Burkholderiaceae bacterium]